MNELAQPPKIPTVNLLARPRQPIVRSPSPRVLQLTLVALAIVLWGAVGAAIALLVGWHPHLGLSP
jgi:hypothetical protein